MSGTQYNLDDVEKEILRLDKKTDWLEMGRWLYLVEKEKLYADRGHDSFNQWAKSGTLNDKLSERHCRRLKDAYRRLCVDNEVDPSMSKESGCQ